MRARGRISIAGVACLLLSVPLAARSRQEPSVGVELRAGAQLDEALASGARLVVPEELARVQVAGDDRVTWFYVQEEDQVQVVVAATYPNKPGVAPSFATEHDPLEVFLAVAPLDAAVPSALLAHFSDRTKALDRDNRVRLKRLAAAALAALPPVEVPRAKEGEVGCAEWFSDWVGSVYGDSTCGSLGFDSTWTHPSDDYCKGGSCEYNLGSVDQGECVPALKTCNRVVGKTYNLRQRMANWHGNGWMAYNGRWAHYGAANCSGNGPILWYAQRGNTIYGPYEIPVHGMLHFANGLGTWNLPASADTNVTYGEWKRGLPPSGELYKYNKSWIENNLGDDDRAILCGDTRNKYVMSDVSSPFCNSADGSISLCTGDNCTSACFHCVGGSCG